SDRRHKESRLEQFLQNATVRVMNGRKSPTVHGRNLRLLVRRSFRLPGGRGLARGLLYPRAHGTGTRDRDRSGAAGARRRRRRTRDRREPPLVGRRGPLPPEGGALMATSAIA